MNVIQEPDWEALDEENLYYTLMQLDDEKEGDGDDGRKESK